MTVCLKIENEAVDVIIILCFKWNSKIAWSCFQDLSRSLPGFKSMYLSLKKKALCDVFMLSDVQCTFTVNLYKGNSINLIFSYDNWIFSTIVKFGTTVLLPLEWFSTEKKVFQNLAHACYTGLTVTICCVYVTVVVFLVF